MKYKEIEVNYDFSYRDTTLQTRHKCLERSAANVYTPSNFRLFLYMLDKTCRCKVQKMLLRGSLFLHIRFINTIEKISNRVCLFSKIVLILNDYVCDLRSWVLKVSISCYF